MRVVLKFCDLASTYNVGKQGSTELYNPTSCVVLCSAITKIRILLSFVMLIYILSAYYLKDVTIVSLLCSFVNISAYVPSTVLDRQNKLLWSEVTKSM